MCRINIGIEKGMVRFHVALLIIFSAISSYAEELRVESFVRDSNINISQKDLNGDDCALIVVESPISNCAFKEAVGDVKYVDGKYHVYVSTGIRRINVTSPNHEHLLIRFKDVSDINEVQSNNRYVLKLTSYDNSSVIGLDYFDIVNRSIRLDSIKIQPIDISARTNERRDGSGERCALLKLSLPLPNCSFTGQVGDAKYNVNEYWLYLSAQTNNITIKFPGYNSLSLKLDEYLQNDRLQPGTTYRLYFSGYNNSLCNLTPEFTDFLNRYEEINDFKDGTANVRRNGKWGVISIEGREITPCKYDHIYAFNEGIAVVKSNGMYGFINQHGGEITPCIYDAVASYKEGLKRIDASNKGKNVNWVDYNKPIFDVNGLASASFDGKWMIINLQGEEFTQLYSYDKFWNRGKFLMVEKNGKDGVTNLCGEEILPCVYDYIVDYEDMPINGMVWARRKNESLKLFDKGGVEILPTDNKYFYEFDDNGLAKFKTGDKYGLVNRQGTVLTPSKYYYIDPFKNGMASVACGISRLRCKYGMINTHGVEVIPCVYDDFFLFNEDGYAKVEKDGKWGIINRVGEEVFPCIYDRVFNDRRDNLLCLKLEEKISIINYQGEELIPYRYDRIEEFISGLAVVSKNKKSGIINIHGQEIIPCVHEYYNIETNYGLIFICNNGKWGIWDSEGNPLMPCSYVDEIWHEFKNGIAVIYIPINDEYIYGAIDCKGDILIPFEYDSIRRIDEIIPNCALAIKKGKEGIINLQGEELLPMEYEVILFSHNDNGKEINDEIARICKNGKWGFLNRSLKEIIACEYDEVWPFVNGIARVKKDGKFGLITVNGEFVIPCIYDSLGDFNNGLARIKLNGKTGLINLLGNTIWFR